MIDFRGLVGTSGAERKVEHSKREIGKVDKMQNCRKGEWNKEKGGASGRFVGALWV